MGGELSVFDTIIGEIEKEEIVYWNGVVLDVMDGLCV